MRAVTTVGPDDVYRVRGLLDADKLDRMLRAQGAWLPDGWEWMGTYAHAPEGAWTARCPGTGVHVHPTGALALWQLGSWDNLEIAVRGPGAPKVVLDMVFNRTVRRGRSVGVTGGSSVPPPEQWRAAEGDLYFVLEPGLGYLAMRMATQRAMEDLEQGVSPTWSGPVLERRGRRWVPWRRGVQSSP